MIDAWIFGIVVVGGSVLFASLGVLLVRRRVSGSWLKRHHEVAGYMLSIVGTLYSVLLGLIVVDTQTKYQIAKQMTQQEADSTLDLFHMSYTMPVETRKAMHKNLAEYLRIVDEVEWDSIDAKGFKDESAKIPFRELWWTLTDYEPSTVRGTEAYSEMLQVLQDMTDGRRYRLQIAKTGMHEVMWGVVIGGGLLTVLFTFLFEVENVKAQLLMTGLVALSLSLNVLLIALFSNPYTGYMRISSYPFKYDRKVIIEMIKLKPE